LSNTVASKTIRYLFTQSESVEVFVCCHPSSKLLQGSIDGFRIWSVDLDGITMRLNRLETQGKQLIFSGYAQIDRIPVNS
jgi:hypothetical protein